ncbi:hypothetical protein Tco_0438019 [Tanacetum coccineum]
MANQEQNPPQQEQPFVATKQIGFNLEDIILNTNNEVALLYPKHNNKDHFKCVSDFISKCCLRKPFTRSPNMYKEYLAEFWYSAKTFKNSKVFFSTPTGGIYGEVGVNTFRNAIGTHYLPYSSEYVAPPSIDIVRLWFETIGYGEPVPTKVTLKKSLLPPRWSLANRINIGYASIFWEDIIIKLNKKHREKDKPVVFKAPKPSSNVERVPQGIKPKAKPGHKKHSTSLKQPFVSSKQATKASFIIHSESASGNDASAASIVEANPGISAPSDFVPQQQGMNEGTKNTSYDHLFVGTNPHVLAYQTKSVSEGLETILAQPITGKGASSIARQIKEETSNIIKLEDRAKLVSRVQPSFNNMNSPEDPVIVVNDSDEDENNEVHATKNVETKDTSVPKSSFPRSSRIQELTNQVLILQSQKHKLELEKNKVEAEAALFKAQPYFPNMEQLKELLDLPSKLNELTGEVKGLKKQVHELEIELPGDLKEIPTKLDDFTKNVTSLTSQVAELKTLQWELPAEFLSLPAHVTSVQANLKTLDALPSLLLNIIQALNKFAQVLNSASSKARDQSSSQPEGEHIKKDKGKKVMSSKDAEEVSTESESDDETAHVPGSMVESSKKKELKKFDIVSESGEHVHLTKEQISAQKKIEEEAKAEAARRKGEIRKEELIDLLGPEVVNKYYNDKLQYDRYCDKMLNIRAKSRITNCDILTRKGPITLKVYRDDNTSEIIPEFKASDLHQAKLRIDLDRPLSEQDPLDRLNNLANNKRNHADDIHDFFRANKRLKSSVQYEDHPAGIVLNEPVLGMILFNSDHKQDFVTIEDFRDFSNTMLFTIQEIFFRLHQGPGLNDHARTFSSLLVAEIYKRNLNKLKQMRVIEQLRQSNLCKKKLFCSLTTDFNLVSSASALQVLRRLGSIFTLVYASVQKLKDSWKELQFSLVDNSKLNVVYLLNRS